MRSDFLFLFHFRKNYTIELKIVNLLKIFPKNNNLKSITTSTASIHTEGTFHFAKIHRIYVCINSP